MPRLISACFALLLAVALPAVPAQAAGATAQAAEIAVLRGLFDGTPLEAGEFSAEFLAQVPLPQIEALVDDLGATIGPIERIETEGFGRYRIVTATHEVSAQIALDAAGTVIGLFFAGPVPTSGSLDEALAGLSGGESMAYLVTRNGTVVASANADEHLAVGSAFKLGILAVLNDQIAAGERSWSDVVTLSAADRSLPTGILQTWPEGAPLTLHTAAALMISQSDNTATDLLLRTVGRPAVEAKLGAGVLSTREFFVLKANPELYRRYSLLDTSVLNELAAVPLPERVTEPHQPGAEWYVPLTTLCALMDEVGDLDVMHINPGVARPADWETVAFKGGSEIGVLNLTTRVIAADGTDYCLSVTWNDDTALDEAGLTVAYAAVLASLARGAE